MKKTMPFAAKVIPLFFSCLLLTVTALRAEEGVTQTAIPGPMGILKKVEGALEIRRAGRAVTATQGDPVYAGDQIITGSVGRAVIELSADKSQIALANTSALLLTSSGENPGVGNGLSLIRGLMWGLKTASGAALSVKTPAADLTIPGAEYFVQVQEPGQTVVVVKDGSVDVSYEQFNLRAGSMSQVSIQKGKQPSAQGITEQLLNEQWAQRFA